MKNLNKHRKAITEAGYTLSKDGTQVKNKSGKTVAGTNDSGFFSGSKVLTNIFKGDKKGEGKKTESKPASKSAAPKTSKRPPSSKKESADKYAPPESPNKAPRISPKPPSRRMTKEQARKYTSASPNGTPSLMSQGGSNAETAEKGLERPGAYSVPKPIDTGENSIFRNAKGEDISKGGWGRLFSRQDGGVKKTTDKDKDVNKVKVSDKGMGTINDVTFAQYENMSQAEKRAKDLPLNLNKRSWKTHIILKGNK
jgi:hypothetical protein